MYDVRRKKCVSEKYLANPLKNNIGTRKLCTRAYEVAKIFNSLQSKRTLSLWNYT